MNHYFNQGFVKASNITLPSETYENQKNEVVKDLKAVEIEYLTLSTGLNFKVINQINDFKTGLITLEISRYSKATSEYIHIEVLVDSEGHFLPNKELCQQDIIRVTLTAKGEKVSKITPAGERHFQKNHISNLSTLLVEKKSKIQTRNGLWYAVDKITHTLTGELELEVIILKSEIKPIARKYAQNGDETSISSREFSPHDIIKVVTF